METLLEMFGQFGAWIIGLLAAVAGFFYVRKQQGDKKLAEKNAAIEAEKARRAAAQRDAIKKATEDAQNVQSANSKLSDADVIERLRRDYRK